MDWYIAQKEPFHFAERLSGAFMGLYRFRVGNYRVLCDLEHGKISVIEVLAVRHRKDAYRSI